MAQHKDQPLQALEVPAQIDLAYVEQLRQSLLQASWHSSGAAATSKVLPAAVFNAIINKAFLVCETEGTLVHVTPTSTQRVTVVGDTHGHYQDLCNLMDKFGVPDPQQYLIMNGDFVDRGAWGVETLILLAACKCALPDRVVLLRGNHETVFCTETYGFKAEILAKYGKSTGQRMYANALKLFAQLPLAAKVANHTLIMHGGLFRVPPAGGVYETYEDLPEEQVSQLRLGSLADLAAASKGGPDCAEGDHLTYLIASDVVWSDPSRLPGMHANNKRGVGTCFGLDVTEAFMASENLKLIIRSHEGPDARVKRPKNDKMADVDSGYSIDHTTSFGGKLITLFSAPQYPMKPSDGIGPFDNKGAICHLTGPDWATPVFHTFEAVPRPQPVCYYADAGDDSDREREPQAAANAKSIRSSASAQAVDAPAAPAGAARSLRSSARQQQKQQQQKQPEEAAPEAQHGRPTRAAKGKGSKQKH